MSDNPSPAPAPPAETGAPPTTTRSGGVNIDSQGGDVHIGGDVVGRDKITQFITNIFQGDAAQRALRNRRNMLELVRNTWVEGVLEKSLYHEMMLDLGLEVRPGEVQRPWDMTLQMPDCENRTLSPGTKIIQVFDDLNHALLVLGEPGSGKTTMLLELARDTIARAEQDPTQPIPVVFNLSSWSADPKQSIADWLVKELHEKYDVHKKIARPWVESDDLLLLLDGLDEVRVECRAACVKAINDFRSEHGQTPFVVCSRIADYEALATQLRLRGAVLIQRLTLEQIDKYLVRAGDELSAVHQALKQDTALQELARSPLMLGIMSLAYSGQSADSLTSVQDDPTQRRKHLFNAYVDKMFARTARTVYEPYRKGDTVRWLAWLAARMSENGQTQFLLEGMQPNWLLSRTQQRAFSTSSSLIIGGLVVGAIIGLFGGVIIGLVHGVIFGLAAGLSYWLLGGLIAVVILVLAGWGSVEPVESLKLSSSDLALVLLFGLWGVLMGAMSGCGIAGLNGLIVGGMIFGLMSGLYALFRTVRIEQVA